MKKKNKILSSITLAAIATLALDQANELNQEVTTDNQILIPSLDYSADGAFFAQHASHTSHSSHTSHTSHSSHSSHSSHMGHA